MRTASFIKRFLMSGKGFNDFVAQYEISPHWKAVGRALTQFMDFGCDTCSGSEKRCCGACSSSVGFHHHLPTNYYTLERYAKMFRLSTGFWRKGKGCILPRHMRSDICVATTCWNHNKLTKIEHAILDIIRYGFETSGKRVKELRPYYVDARNNMIHIDYQKLFKRYFSKKTGLKENQLASWIRKEMDYETKV